MALAITNTSVNTASNWADWSHTSNSGTDTCLIVILSYAGCTTRATSVKYNDVNLTKKYSFASSQYYDQYYNQYEVWFLNNPPTGSNTIVVSHNDRPSIVIGYAITFSGCNGSAPVQKYSITGSIQTGDHTSYLTTEKNNSYIIETMQLYGSNGPNTGTPGSGQTALGANNYFLYSTHAHGTSYKATGGSAGSYSMTRDNVYMGGGLVGSAHILIEIIEKQISGPAKLKTRNGLAVAKIKTINGLAIEKTKTINGLS